MGVTTNVGGDVISWVNQATGNDVNSGDPETSVVAGPNGQTMIRFSNSATTGPDAGLQYDSSGSLSAGFTLIAVIRLQDTLQNGNNFPRFLRGEESDTPALFGRSSNGDIELKASPISSGTRPDFPYAPTFGNDDIAVITARATATEVELYFNGVLVEANAVTSPVYTISSTFEIGNRVQGDIGEILVYDSSASLADVLETSNQLVADYATIPEPASAVLAGIAMLSTLGFVRRRRNS